ncbi:MAG: hypothetical protein ACOC9Z_01270 [Chloroflexota bacterium]
MRWNLHGIKVAGKTNDANLRRRWQAAFASLPPGEDESQLTVTLNLVNALPHAPQGEPQYRQGDLLHYYVSDGEVIAHFPRYGRLQIDVRAAHSEGRLARASLERYGVLEDLIAIALSPHLRRRGKFLIHAFAAAQAGRALLLVGDVGAGKTTTGMALLQAGWRLLSNDSPIVDESGDILSYPGLLAAYPDTMQRFPATRALVTGETAPAAQKITVAAEALWPNVWTSRASPTAICFPQIGGEDDHRLQPLAAPESLRRLLPHAIEQWDKEMIPSHLAVLRRLAEATQGYTLRLGPDISTLPTLLQQLLDE